MPSSSIASCAGVTVTLPSAGDGQTKRPRSRRLLNKHAPCPSHQMTLIRSPRRPLFRQLFEHGAARLLVERLPHVRMGKWSVRKDQVQLHAGAPLHNDEEEHPRGLSSATDPAARRPVHGRAETVRSDRRVPRPSTLPERGAGFRRETSRADTAGAGDDIGSELQRTGLPEHAPHA